MFIVYYILAVYLATRYFKELFKNGQGDNFIELRHCLVP
jgi:hypothetical protein